MQIHLGPQNLWREHNEALAKSLGINLDRYEVRVFQNIQQAVTEAMLGLRRLYSIKKKIYFVKHQVPHTEPPLKSLAKEGLQLEALSPEVFKSPEEIVAKIDRESHFVVYAVDDPVLATLQDVSAFENALADAAIFKIRISYHRHRIEGLPTMDRNTIHILGSADGSAVALLGERMKFSPQGVENLNWSGFDRDNALAGLQKQSSVSLEKNRDLILKFEARTDLGFTPVLPTDAARIYDRALVVWKDLDSAAMQESLGQKYLGPVLESLSLSHWGGTKGFDWLSAKGFSKELLRGALVINADIITEELAQDIRECRRQIIAAQSGE